MVLTICTAQSVMAGWVARKAPVNQRSGVLAAVRSRPLARTTTPRCRQVSALEKRAAAETRASAATRSGRSSASRAPTAAPSSQPA